MKREIRYLLFGMAFGLILAGGVAWVLHEPRPRSFDDCVLKNIKPGLSDQAVSLVYLSCREIFPKERPLRATTQPAPRRSLLDRLIPGNAAPSPAAPLEVTLDFTQECWVEAVIDGRERISELHVQGESLQLAAAASVLLANVGNPAGVDVQVNGIPFALGGTAGRPVQDVLIDLDTLARLRLRGR
jgi:hypothetical protein